MYKSRQYTEVSRMNAAKSNRTLKKNASRAHSTKKVRDESRVE